MEANCEEGSISVHGLLQQIVAAGELNEDQSSLSSTASLDELNGLLESAVSLVDRLKQSRERPGYSHKSSVDEVKLLHEHRSVRFDLRRNFIFVKCLQNMKTRTWFLKLPTSLLLYVKVKLCNSF